MITCWASTLTTLHIVGDNNTMWILCHIQSNLCLTFVVPNHIKWFRSTTIFQKGWLGTSSWHIHHRHWCLGCGANSKDTAASLEALDWLHSSWSQPIPSKVDAPEQLVVLQSFALWARQGFLPKVNKCKPEHPGSLYMIIKTTKLSELTNSFHNSDTTMLPQQCQLKHSYNHAYPTTVK